jgi:hypothetical protein
MWRVAQGDEVRERRGQKREWPGLRSLKPVAALLAAFNV